jgi:RND family efflux transporter MFP subunit
MRFVAPGQPVQLEARAFPGEVFRGTVDRIGDVLDEKTRAVTVRVSLPNPGHRLKPGMFATVRIVGTRAIEPRRMLAIPWAAIQEIDGHVAVFVREGERAFDLRRVHTGERAGELVEVLNGLRPGEVVVAEGSFLLKGELLKSTLGEEE